MSEKTLELPEGMTADKAIDVLREFHTTEEAQIISADTLSAKDEKLEEFAGVFRDALKAEKGLKEETVDAMGVDALAHEFRNEDGEIEADTLSQTPETETTDEPAEPEKDTLSAAEKREVEDKLRRADLMESRTPDHADTLRSEAADMAGVEDADEIEVDAL
jgi:hypothetical protein